MTQQLSLSYGALSQSRILEGSYWLAGLSIARIEASGDLSRKSRIYFFPNLFAARRDILKRAERCSPLAYQMSMNKFAIQSGNFQISDFLSWRVSIANNPMITTGKVGPNQTNGRIRYEFGPHF
jgi:hypothetical protein